MQSSDWDSSVAFESDSDQSIEYRSVSKFAVLTVIAGLASILAWFSAVMWCVPVFAVLLGCFAFREIRQNDAYTGRGVAMLGIALALLFGIGAVTSFFAERQIVTRQAKQFASRFLELGLAGNVEHAAQLTDSYQFRMTPGLTRDAYYRIQPESMTVLQRVQADDFIKRLVKAGPDAKVTFIGVESFEKVRYGQICGLKYVVDDGEPFDAVLLVTRERNPEISKFTHWQVRSFGFTKDG